MIFTNQSARVECDTRPIFKRSLIALNTELSFSWTCCLTKAKENSLSYYIYIIVILRVYRWINLRVNSISSSWNIRESFNDSMGE